ncbi:Protein STRICTOSIDINE SYNTHASE-LIKE 3, partial [Bienertia sinuspersici]
AKQIWLKGEKVGTSESFAILPGFPTTLEPTKRSIFGWHCTVDAPNKSKVSFHGLHGVASWSHSEVYSEASSYRSWRHSGEVVKAVSEVEEREGKIWIESVLMSFVAAMTW